MRMALPLKAGEAGQLSVAAASNELPDLPPEWGKVTIPDDPGELAADAELIRHELREEAELDRRRAAWAQWRRRLRLPERIDDPQQPTILLPLIVLGVALLITLFSLIILPNLTAPPVTPLPATPSAGNQTTGNHS
jgi:hypothetical protein